MKQIITLLFILLSVCTFAQTKSTNQQVPVNDVRQVGSQTNSRTNTNSAQTQVKPVTPLPYDVNDKYMGRKDEFLNSMIISELPSDFPVYDKQWGVKEYNGVVDAYYMTHMDILKDRVKQKIQYQIDQQQIK